MSAAAVDRSVARRRGCKGFLIAIPSLRAEARHTPPDDGSDAASWPDFFVISQWGNGLLDMSDLDERDFP
jgi:hypothetical protein